MLFEPMIRMNYNLFSTLTKRTQVLSTDSLQNHSTTFFKKHSLSIGTTTWKRISHFKIRNLWVSPVNIFWSCKTFWSHKTLYILMDTQKAFQLHYARFIEKGSKKLLHMPLTAPPPLSKITPNWSWSYNLWFCMSLFSHSLTGWIPI